VLPAIVNTVASFVFCGSETGIDWDS